MSLLEHEPLAEFYLIVWPDGRTRMADAKLDTYDAATMGRIFKAAVQAFCAWMQQYGQAPAGVIGDGGPEITALRAKVYAQQEEVATLRARLEARS
jgi:hypothetical protein